VARIFISYSSHDNDWAIRVRDWLKENGWDDIFLGLDLERRMAAGESWKAALQKAADRCDVVLALVSPEWLASEWCKAEMEAARRMGKSVIVALIGADEAQIPIALAQQQFVELANDRHGFARLTERLRRERDELYRERMAKAKLPPTVEVAALVPDQLTVAAMLSMSALRSAVAAGAPAGVVPPAPAPSAPWPAPVPPPPARGDGGFARTPPAPAPASPRPAPAPPPPAEGGGFAGSPPARATSAPPSAPPPPPARGGGGFARTLPIALIAIVAAYLISRSWGQGVFDKMLTYLNFKLNVVSFFGLLKGCRSEPKPQIDLVDCSVFSPPVAPPGSTVLVQVFLHVPQHAERAHFMASMMDQTTAPKGVQTLKSEMARGASVTVSLSAAGLDIDEPQQTVIWRGEPVFCQFLVSLPKGCVGQSFHPVVRISVDGGLVGRLVFCLKADAVAGASLSVPAGESARRYEHAFISYASADRKEVLKRAQVLKAAGVGFFQDILSLDPGTRWEREIYRNIDKCDLVLLFWSRAAKDSEWVIREAEYALERRGDGDIPDVVPVILETPPPLPPPSLASIHFNDRIHYLIAADSGASCLGLLA
jgi:hypothetical protein